MASTWGNSWGTNWAHSWDVRTTPPVDNTAGQTILTKGAGSGRAFTRKHFHEFMEAERARKALEAKANKTTGKQRKALLQTADIAADAIETARALESVEAEAQVARLTKALEAAAGATRVKQAIADAKAAARAIALMMEQEDEEEAAMLLLN